MVRSAVRTALCLLLGAVAGLVLGPLFVPDPTGVLAGVLTIAVTGVVSIFLYRTDWLREQKSIA
jgi:O-antigen/teichoic acid export membrane protein